MQNLPLPVQRILTNEDAWLGVVIAWLVGIPVCTLLGFYALTILGNDHKMDLRLLDMERGAFGAVGGLVIGILLAAAVTVFYPPAVEADSH